MPLSFVFRAACERWLASNALLWVFAHHTLPASPLTLHTHPTQTHCRLRHVGQADLLHPAVLHWLFSYRGDGANYR